MLFFQGRFMGAVAAVLLLGASIATFTLSCVSQTAIGAILRVIGAFPANYSCVPILPPAMGAAMSIIFLFLAGVALLQAVVG